MAQQNEVIIGIDPGTTKTGYCIVDKKTYKPLCFGKIYNADLFDTIDCFFANRDDVFYNEVAIEMVASYGMPVGAEVFDTCVWIGRFLQKFTDIGKKCEYVYRKDEKLNICHSMSASDTNIRQALVDRFAKGLSNHGKGTKKEQGWFYGFSADMWSAYAVAITYLDWKYNKNKGDIYGI